MYKVVLTNGVFDLIHVGHIRLLQKARDLGKFLIVAINSDRSVREIKGAGRPIIPQDERKEMLEALHCVDAVVIFDDPDPLRVILEQKPHILVKGEPWTRETTIGAAEVEAWGGRVEIIPLEPGYSTTSLIERIRKGAEIAMECGHPSKFGGFTGPNWKTSCRLCYMAMELDSRVREARNSAIDETLEIYERAFENNWVVQDCIDHITSLKR